MAKIVMSELGLSWLSYGWVVLCYDKLSCAKLG